MTSNGERDVYIRERYYAGRSAIELGVERWANTTTAIKSQK